MEASTRQRRPRRPRSVSRLEAEVLADLRRRKRSYLDVSEDREILTRGRDRNPYVVAHRMADKGLLLPLRAGTYVAVPEGTRHLEQVIPFEVALHAALVGSTEYFIGYLSALIEHGLTDIDSEVVYVAARIPSRRLAVAGRPVLVTQITSERKWFGFETVPADREHYVRACIERALLDCLDRPRHCGSPEVWVRAWERAFRQGSVDLDRLVEGAQRLGRSVARRAAFWLSHLGHAEAIPALLEGAGTLRAPVLLDSSRSFGGGDWPTDSRFGLTVNIPERAYQGWIGYAK